MATSIQRVVSDGSLVTLPLSIDYFERAEISVFFNDTLAVLSAWDWVGLTDSTLTFTPAVPNGVEVLVKRTTDTSGPRHVFTKGAQFNSASLDENTTQALRAAQEIQEGSGIKEIFNDINMHGYRVKNVAVAVAPGDAIPLGQYLADAAGANAALVAAQALYDAFDDRYLGAKSADPTADNDGNTIGIGALYYNTVVGELRAFNGVSWQIGVGSSLNSKLFSGTGAQVAFVLDSIPSNENNTQVYVNGVYQQKDTYSLVGATITFSEAPPAGVANIEVMTVVTLALGTVAAGNTSYVPTDGVAETNVQSAIARFGSWIKAAALSAGSAAVGFIQAGTGAVLRTVQDKLRDTINVKDFGAVGDGVTDDTAAIQAAIDYAASRYSVANGYPKGGGVVHFPDGAFKFTQIVRKNGVSLRGAGRYRTLLQMAMNGGRGFRCAAADTQSYTGGVYYLDDSDFSLIPDPSTAFTAPTILWDMTGFTRCTWRNLAFGFKGNVTAVSMRGATLAGSGGPSQWYNSFYDVFVEGETGGIGWDLGDPDVDKEQITTWNWYGGRTASGNNTGIGMRLNSATGCNLYGHVFEALSDELIIGSAAGTRGCSRVNLFGCYFEGSVRGYTIHPNASGTGLWQYFATGVSNVDNGVLTLRMAEAETSLPVSNTVDSFKLVQSDPAKKPQVVGSTSPGIRFKNDAGAFVDVACGAALSSGNSYYSITDDTGRVFIKGGAASTNLYQSSLFLANQSTVGIFYDAGTPTFAAANGSICVSPNGFFVRAAGAWVAK